MEVAHCSANWRGMVDSKQTTPLQVLAEFEELYEFRFFGFMRELFSPLITPLVLVFCIPRCCEDIVIHIAENTVLVPGVGHISSFSNFDFQKHGNPQYGASVAASTAHQAKDGKMERAFLHFIRMYPMWQPSPDGQRLMDTLVGYLNTNPGVVPLASPTTTASVATTTSATAGMGASTAMLRSISPGNEVRTIRHLTAHRSLPRLHAHSHTRMPQVIARLDDAQINLLHQSYFQHNQYQRGHGNV